MKIAVAADGQSLNSHVAEEFTTCEYLLVVNMEDLNVVAVENPGDAAGVKLASEVINYGCEGIISGKLKPEAFDLLVKACVTRFFGAGYSVQRALVLMEKNALKLIKNYQGTDVCEGAHHIK